MLVGKSSAWQGRDNVESVEFDPDKPCRRSSTSGKNGFGFLIALSENRVTLVFFASMMVLAVFLAGINVLYVLGTAACTAFDGMLDLCFECGLCRAFCKNERFDIFRA